MRWTVEPGGEGGYVVVATAGTFDVSDHLRMTEDILSRPYWVPGTPVLFDHRQLDFGDAGFRAMQEAGANHLTNDARIGDGKAAILMSSPVDFGRGRQFELLTEGRRSARLRIFLDEGEALAWLTGTMA
jgi:hypothetical protein